MPISNPILQGLTVVQGVDLTLATTDPIAAPAQSKKFWFNYVARNLFLAIATNSVADWIALGSPEWVDIENKPNTFPSTWEQVSDKPNTFPSTWEQVSDKPNTFPSTWEQVANKPNTFPADVASVANKIVVQDGQVLTTDDNVIFED